MGFLAQMKNKSKICTDKELSIFPWLMLTQETLPVPPFLCLFTLCLLTPNVSMQHPVRFGHRGIWRHEEATRTLRSQSMVLLCGRDV